MDPVMAACANMYGTNDHLLSRALDGLSESEAWHQPGDANPIAWIAGHMAVYRHLLASTLGVGTELPWTASFKRTSQPERGAGTPSLAEIRAALASASEPLMARLATLTDEELAKEAPMKVPTKDPSLRGLIAFFAYHESYHVGQIAYVKKWLGYPGIVDGQ